MRHRSLLTIAVLFLVATAAWAQVDPTTFAAFPTASTTDGRFLAFACAGLFTLEQGVTLQVEAPANSAGFTFSVFDGDGGLTDAFGAPHWDSGTHAISLRLYGDPLHQGATTDLLGTWISNIVNDTVGPTWTTSGPTMLDNAWWSINVTNTAAARAPSGNYFYTLVIQHSDTCAPGESSINNLKIAASNPIAFETTQFGMEAGFRANADRGILYPGFDPFSTNPKRYLPPQETTFDGTWEFRLNIPGGETDFRLFDGDFDHGTNGLNASPSGVTLTPCADTDDADTAADYAGFPFSPNSASGLEGVNAPGNPPDDNAADAFRRGEPGNADRIGCVRYEVTDPLGRVYRNNNPSGNQEWEQFRIAGRAASDYLNSDYILPVGEDFVPAGEWKVKIVGLDMSNLNFWYADTCAVRNGGAACVEPDVYLLGDTVWSDLDGNRSQAASGEPGIAGVKMELVRPSDLAVVATTVTGDVTDRNWAACKLKNTGTGVKVDETGLYCFGVERPGTYIVRVAASNFLAGGALEGLAATTVGGNQQTNTIVNDNVLTYDFGYRPIGSIGDYVWWDDNANKLQDDGISKGLAGVQVVLIWTGPDGQAGTGDDVPFPNAVTVNGTMLKNYLFSDLRPGIYTVNVDKATLPQLTYPDVWFPTTEPDTFEVKLAAGQMNFLNADFGYDKKKDKTSFRGCTPGYWKQPQHFDSWGFYGTTNRFNTIFGITGSFPAYGGSPAGNNGNPTLLMALSTGGGGYKAFNRHAAAALLNIQNPGVNYYYSLSALMNYVKTAYSTGNFEYYKNLLATTNELNCPLN